MSDRVTLETRSGVGIIAMSRPDRRNAMDTLMLKELIHYLDNVRSDGSLAGAVITGSGDTFSAGADIEESVDKVGATERMSLFTRLYEVVSGFPKPTVAAITGHCIGGGAEVAASCDLRVGTAKTRIKFPGAQFGIPVGAARLPVLIGLSWAKDLLLTARTIEGEEAFRIGFLNRLVEEKELLEVATELATLVSSNPGALEQKRRLDEAVDLRARVARENRALARWQCEATKLMGD